MAINVVKLAERSQMVLFFREALYRVCEVSLNENIDVVVIQKSDLPRADQMQSELQPLLDLPNSRRVPLVRVSAVRNEGLQELWNVIQSCARNPNRK